MAPIQLNPTNWQEGENPNSWCLSTDKFEAKEENLFDGSPYQLPNCNP